MLHRYQNMFKVIIMRKISKADLSLRNLKKLIKKEFNETDKLIKNQNLNHWCCIELHFYLKMKN